MSHTIEHVVITRALELLEGGWTSHTFARDRLGQAVSPFFPDAVSFCALGALMRASHQMGLDVSEFIDRNAFYQSLPEINDGQGKMAVMEVLRQRIV